MDSSDLRRLAAAYDLAIRAHEGQSRRQGRGEPFVNHVADVARRVSVSDGADLETVLAAVLHDVAEKTGRTLLEIEAAFGTEVAGVVAELTEDGDQSSDERHGHQVEQAGRLSERARRVKLADLASKLAAIAADPPGLLGRPGARTEVRRAEEVAARLLGLDPALDAAFARERRRVHAALGDEAVTEASGA